MIVLSGSASRGLGKALSSELGCGLVESELRVFPDGEFKVTADVSDKVAIIVQSCPFPQTRNLAELLFLIEACKGASKRIVVIPYFPFSRQDKQFLKGEVVSSKAVAKLIEAMGADAVVTLDLQMKYAEPLRKEVGGKSFFFEKRRDRVTGEVKFAFPQIDCKGKDVIIADDIVTSGSTMMPAIKFSKERGAQRVFVAVTHPLFLEGVSEKLRLAGANAIIASDSFERKDVVNVSSAKSIADAVKKLL
ncbi:MAG: ribose-phosphate pyrophosphokinase [Candidatus Aenigmarchaeota archaeon]|nr:ribose-phosphate pyrophosphokinase [Candidatus Aenigmarchaeota archaeon]